MALFSFTGILLAREDSLDVLASIDIQLPDIKTRETVTATRVFVRIARGQNTLVSLVNVVG